MRDRKYIKINIPDLSDYKRNIYRRFDNIDDINTIKDLCNLTDKYLMNILEEVSEIVDCMYNHNKNLEDKKEEIIDVIEYCITLITIYEDIFKKYDFIGKDDDLYHNYKSLKLYYNFIDNIINKGINTSLVSIYYNLSFDIRRLFPIRKWHKKIKDIPLKEIDELNKEKLFKVISILISIIIKALYIYVSISINSYGNIQEEIYNGLIKKSQISISLIEREFDS